MDIKRTILWVVFSLSLLILWDNWMRYSGKPSMFFPTATQPAKPVASGASGSADVPQPGSAVAAQAATASAIAAAGTPAAAQGEVVTIATDIMKAEINSVGGELKRLELLKHKE